VPLAVEINETELPAHAAALVGFVVTDGGALTVTVALPVPVFEQFASTTLETVYVVVEAGVTVRVAGVPLVV
jgi:hypothetical protein